MQGIDNRLYIGKSARGFPVIDQIYANKIYMSILSDHLLNQPIKNRNKYMMKRIKKPQYNQILQYLQSVVDVLYSSSYNVKRGLIIWQEDQTKS